MNEISQSRVTPDTVLRVLSFHEPFWVLLQKWEAEQVDDTGWESILVSKYSSAYMGRIHTQNTNTRNEAFAVYCCLYGIPVPNTSIRAFDEDFLCESYSCFPVSLVQAEKLSICSCLWKSSSRSAQPKQDTRRTLRTSGFKGSENAGTLHYRD